MKKSFFVLMPVLIMLAIATSPACKIPAKFEVESIDITPQEITVGEICTVTVRVKNIGGNEGVYTTILILDGAKTETKDVTIAPGAIQVVTFSIAMDKAGTYELAVGGLRSNLTVKGKPTAFEQLKIAYPSLYHELVKLPDLKEMDEKDKAAAEDIAYSALNLKDKTAFESMLNEGVKEGRKYCSPLEALLWVAYDKQLQRKNPLEYYSLEYLLIVGWRESITSNNYRSDRWQNFEEVVARLNSPKLVTTYMLHNMRFSYTPFEAEGVKSAEQIFSDKKGACYDLALFAAYCLKRNGYGEAKGLYIRFERPFQSFADDKPFTYYGHILCIYQDPKDSLFYTIDTFGRIKNYGPFKSVEEAAKHSSWKQGLAFYSLYDIDTNTGKFKTTWRQW